MNREDAIKELKILLKYAKRVDEIMGGGTEQSDTLDFAIKSLQMPIIAFACDGRKCGGDCSGCGRTTDIEHAKNFTKVIDTYFEILQTEPSKNAYERGKAEALEWIPCDEKLPSESGRYLVSYVLLNDEICTGIAHYGKPLLPLNTNETECGWYKTDGDGDFYVDDILAWKPLPKPYCPQNDTDIGTTEPTVSHEEAWADCDLAKDCKNLAKDCETDLVSRAEVHKVLSLLATEGGKDAKLLFSDAHESIDNLPSVSAKPTNALKETETKEHDDLIIKNGKGIQDGLYNIKDGEIFKYKSKGGTARVYKLVDCVSAERVDCDSCIYKIMWQEQEKAETLDRHTLDVLQERFEAEELKAHAKSSGLKEHATWNKAIRILEEYMEEGDNDND